MCKNCLEIMSKINPKVLELVKKFEPMVEELAEKIGSELGEEITSGMDETYGQYFKPEEFGEIKRKHLNYTGVLLAVGYVAGKQNHVGLLCQDLMHPVEQGIMVGYHDFGAEEEKKSMN